MLRLLSHTRQAFTVLPASYGMRRHNSDGVSWGSARIAIDRMFTVVGMSMAKSQGVGLCFWSSARSTKHALKRGLVSRPAIAPDASYARDNG